MEEGISILIAAYNADKYIKECINSITTITPHEILVGIDGCKKTLNVVNKLKNENLKVFNKEKKHRSLRHMEYTYSEGFL